MSNQSFNQFAGQQQFGAQGAPVNPVNPGFQQPGTPAGYGPPQGAPVQGQPGGFVPQGAPPAGPSWPAQGQPQQAPQGAPMQAPQGQPFASGPGWQQPAGPVPGFQAPPQQFAPPQQQQMPSQGYAQAPQAAFGAGAFAAAKIMGNKKPCAFGTYVFEVAETAQLKDPEKGTPYWCLRATVVQPIAAPQGAQPQAVGSEVTTAQGMVGNTQMQYCGSFMLQLACACLGANNEAELRQKLNAQFQPVQQNGVTLDGWAQIADAMQNPTTQMNNCPPNPLKGCRFVADIVPNPSKKDGKMYEKWTNLRRVA
jgi:hypothetical protein